MFYESLIILNISTLNFSEGVPASVLCSIRIKFKVEISSIFVAFLENMNFNSITKT